MSWYINSYYVILALGILTGAIRFHTLSASSRWFWGLLVCTAVVESIAWYGAEIVHKNLAVYRFFVPVQYVLIAVAYRNELSRFNLLALLSTGFIVIFWLADTTLNFSLIHNQYPTFLKTICNILIISWSLLFLNALLRSEIVESFVTFPLFWLSTGWLLFSIVNLIFFGTVNYLGKEQRDFLLFFSYARIGSNLILYSLFIVAFLAKQNRIPTSSS
jgi:hypothetical protein